MDPNVPPPTYEESQAASYEPIDQSQIDVISKNTVIEDGVNEEGIKKEKNTNVNNQPLINNHSPIITTQPTSVAAYTAVDGGGTHVADDSCCTYCLCLSVSWDRSVCCHSPRCCSCDDCCDGDGDCDNCCGDCGDCCDCDCGGMDCGGCDCGGCDCAF
ncbi:hypothetical protein LOTGIDRAFT_157625 [Lottia gigantea]|uniref:Uncharacterized protein n=1 Tax=Lottia gigantea TaxID=225164 RepID=V4B1Z3_LOTGI|nr:hypothetical protein LOTGIDRAFT_157625 [Lottia gigantea]ESP01441.1 hypothetical protein LOTGIDRAFT_157625 [Lottia gigantea]